MLSIEQGVTVPAATRMTSADLVASIVERARDDQWFELAGHRVLKLWLSAKQTAFLFDLAAREDGYHSSHGQPAADGATELGSWHARQTKTGGAMLEFRPY